MNLTVKNYEHSSTFVEVIALQTWPGTFDTPCINQTIFYFFQYLSSPRSLHFHFQPIFTKFGEKVAHLDHVMV